MLKNYIVTLSVLISTAFVQSHSEVISISKPTVFVVEETKKWFCGTPQFQNCSTDKEVSNSIVDLLAWKTPDYIVKNFPYYISGVSYDELPIYIGETGKYDVVAMLRQGPELMENFEKTVAQILVRALSTVEKGGDDGTNHRFYAIMDFEGFKFSQYASVPAIELITRVVIQYRAMAQNFVQKIVVINGNYAVDTLYKTFLPLVGSLSEHVEIYGPSKPKWTAALRREFPLAALPPWYGGYANFTPVAAYG